MSEGRHIIANPAHGWDANGSPVTDEVIASAKDRLVAVYELIDRLATLKINVQADAAAPRRTDPARYLPSLTICIQQAKALGEYLTEQYGRVSVKNAANAAPAPRLEECAP